MPTIKWSYGRCSLNGRRGWHYRVSVGDRGREGWTAGEKREVWIQLRDVISTLLGRPWTNVAALRRTSGAREVC